MLKVLLAFQPTHLAALERVEGCYSSLRCCHRLLVFQLPELQVHPLQMQVNRHRQAQCAVCNRHVSAAAGPAGRMPPVLHACHAKVLLTAGGLPGCQAARVATSRSRASSTAGCHTFMSLRSPSRTESPAACCLAKHSTCPGSSAAMASFTSRRSSRRLSWLTLACRQQHAARDPGCDPAVVSAVNSNIGVTTVAAADTHGIPKRAALFQSVTYLQQQRSLPSAKSSLLCKGAVVACY